MRLIVAAAVLLLAQSVPAAAQSRNDALASLGIKIAEPMSAKELVRTKVRVAAELARSGATPHFDDISDGYGGKVRHRSSGLVCPLGAKGQRVLQASAHSAVCETINNGATYKTAVERAPAGATLETVAAGSLAKAQREPGYKPYEGLSVVGRPKAGSEQPEHRTIRFFSTVNRRERAVRLQVGLVRGWILSERREARNHVPLNNLAELLSEATFGVAMKRN